jgi:glycosyltransferase involved in cell wall biosynthesis
VSTTSGGTGSASNASNVASDQAADSPESRSTNSATVILPVHNQGDHIEGVVEGFLAAVGRLPLPVDFLLVANGCTDDSERVCRGLSDRYAEIEVIVLDRRGWGRAVRAGLRAARGDLLCYTNSARTAPEMLGLALLYAQAYPGVVVKANRRTRDSLRRRIGSLLFNLECRALFDLSAWDINGTPKVFPRSLPLLSELRRDDDLIDVEFNIICRRKNYPMIEVPVLATVRHGGDSTTGYLSALRLYWGAWRLREAMREGSR